MGGGATTTVINSPGEELSKKVNIEFPTTKRDSVGVFFLYLSPFCFPIYFALSSFFSDLLPHFSEKKKEFSY